MYMYLKTVLSAVKEKDDLPRKVVKKISKRL